MLTSGMDAAQPVPRKFSRYRSVRRGTAPGKGADSKDEQSVCPTLDEGKTNEENPSIARSMSRYRRNRPSANSVAVAPPTPAVPDHTRARAQVGPPLPKPADRILTAQEERAKERHRHDAMEKLMGGDQTSHSIPHRPARSEKERQSKRESDRQGLRKATQSRKSQGDRRVGTDAPANDATRKSFFQKLDLAKIKEPVKQDEAAPKYIGVGGGGIVPGTDAPISAVNAGERRVLVQYSDTSVELTVTPSIRVQDLLKSAFETLSRNIDPDKFILIESYHQIGLERPLRRYERVRDVMNSWAHDGDNRLIVIPPSSMDALAQLDAQQVSSEKPAEDTVFLYHSQRPGKWDKRYVTLRPDGQIVISKKEKSKVHTDICHLSDFDIYSPNARALAKEIKPPKNICFAIKSQQKSSMFLSTEKFVHFFSTNDRAVADKWYRVTQAWRSWYLVNKMGAAEKTECDVGAPKRSLMQKGSLLDRQTGDAGPRPTSSKDIFSHKKGTREHAPPPSSFPKTLQIDTSVTGQSPLVPGMSPREMEAATFSPAGLLGRTYTQRQQAMREREARERQAMQDSFAGQSMLAGSPMISPGYTSSHENGRTNNLTRVCSINQKQKPLVDLTPVYQEPPQHARKGRRVAVEPGVKLVDAATGPELVPGSVATSPATAWRRPSVDVPSQARNRANTVRSFRHVPAPYKTSRGSSAEASPMSPAIPFRANSLLASSSRMPSQGEATTGHGVATGDRNASRPMLDMSPENPFAEGSLLRKL